MHLLTIELFTCSFIAGMYIYRRIGSTYCLKYQEHHHPLKCNNPSMEIHRLNGQFLPKNTKDETNPLKM